MALNISGCPNRCKGCHSPHLWEDTGEELTTELLDALVNRYNPGITCVCFMGGDQDATYVASLAEHVHNAFNLKTAWYSGQNFDVSNSNNLEEFDFVKVGPYIAECGGLKSPTTNQRFYRKEGTIWIDETYKFQQKHPI